MGRKVNIVLPSGDVVSVDESQAKLAEQGDMRLETTGEMVSRGTAVVNERKFGGAGDQALAFGEGLLSTLTLGIADPFINDEATQLRAQVNPNARLAGEVAGVLAPALLSPTGLAGKALKYSPGGLAHGAGKAAGKLAGSGAVRQLGTAAAVEGAFQGAGGAISKSTISDDPLTVEAVLHGAGRGALLGFGVGSVAGGLVKIGGKAKTAEQRALESEVGSVLKAQPEVFNNTTTNLKALKQASSEKLKQASVFYDSLPTDKPLKMKVKASYLREAGTISKIKPDKVARYKDMRAQGLEGPPISVTVAPEGGVEIADGAHRLASFGDDEFITVKFSRGVSGSGKVPERVAQAQAAANLRVPESLEEFATWQPSTVADWVNSARAAGPEGAATINTLADLAGQYGISGDDVAAKVVGLHRASRSVAQAETKAPGIFGRMFNRAGRLAGARMTQKAVGTAEPLRSLAYEGGKLAGSYLVGGPVGVAAEALGLRAALTTRVRTMIAKYGESGGERLAKLGPVTARLSQTMFGEHDDAEDISELALNRANELYRMGPAAADAAFAVGAPLAHEGGRDFGLALAHNLTSGVQYLLDRTPQDPGTAHVMGKSDWRPSIDQAESFAASLEAAEDPWASIERAMGGDFDPAASETLWSLWPATMTELQLEAMAQAPKLQDLDYDKVISLSMLFRTPLDGLMLPQHVAALQSVFIPGNAQPSGGNSTGATGGAPGRPAASTPPTGGTMVQNLTAR